MEMRTGDGEARQVVGISREMIEKVADFLVCHSDQFAILV
jgi:hypothetical protein